MTPDQFSKFIEVLQGLKDHDAYTLSGAQDWYMLVTLGGMVVVLLVYIWQDLKITMKEHRTEAQCDISKEVTERKEQDELIWKYIRDCQEDCCPRKKGI